MDNIASLPIWVILTIAIISAGLGSFFSLIQSTIILVVERKNRNKKIKEEKQDKFKTRKEEAYLGALNKLLLIKKGFSITREEYSRSVKLQDEFKHNNNELANVDSVFRLYASDQVFNFYFDLTNNYSKYSFARESDWRLGKDEKESFDILVSVLSRLMQKDLGYREYDETPITIKCPNCGREHDAFKDCNCGLTFSNLPTALKIKAKGKKAN